MVFRVTLFLSLRPGFFLADDVIYKPSEHLPKLGLSNEAGQSLRRRPAKRTQRPVNHDSSLAWRLRGKLSRREADTRFRPRAGIHLHIYVQTASLQSAPESSGLPTPCFSDFHNIIIFL